MDTGYPSNCKCIRMFANALRIIAILVIAFPATGSVLAAGPWYVATTGNDSNSCTSPAEPCLTINGAIGKATAGDTIKVASGTYTGSGLAEVVSIQKDIILSGGWDATYTIQNDLSTIDGEEARRAITVSSGITTLIDRFWIYRAGRKDYTIEGGIYSSGSLTISNSMVTDNPDAGITEYTGTLTVKNSTIGNNANQGIRIYYSSVELNNSTVSNNSGSGIFNWGGSLVMNNSTITGNTSADDAAGISSDYGTITMGNSILAGNGSLSGHPDCDGSSTISSSGYNLIGDASGCSFSASIGDQVGTGDNPIDPKLGPLADNGGLTYTHGLAEDSPALNAGNPAAPGSGGNACFGTDQRGVARPLDNVCDIGAFEGTLMIVPSTWYVALTGDDSNSCASPAAPCLTINTAIARATTGDIIDVAIGTYVGSSPEVVLVNKHISLLGGWDASFTDQTGVSTVDGQQARRGILVDIARTVKIDHFAVKNGFHAERGGGIQNNGFLTLSKSLVVKNTVLDGGGGISNAGRLILNDSTISNNAAGYISGGGSQGGAGILSRYAPLTLNNSTVSGNTVFGSSSGSAIDASFTVVVLNNSTITSNTGAEAIEIYETDMTVNNTTIVGNPRGGIKVYGGAARLRNSIAAMNTSDAGYDCVGSVVSLGYNLIGDDTFCDFTPITGDLVGTNASPIDPGISPLADYGGSTLTHALRGDSPALNAGNPGTPGSGGDTCLATDQRGIARPVDGVCDIGAVEGFVTLVASSNRANANPTSAASIAFILKFTEPVTGVDTTEPFSDFNVTTTGLSGAAITAVSGSGDTYEVKVNVGTGLGTIRLDVLDDDSITAISSGNPLGGPGIGNGNFTSGEEYSIVELFVASITRANPNPTSKFNVKFTVKFSEAVTGVNAVAPFSDFTLATTGVTGAIITSVSGSGNSYTVTVKTGKGNGSIRLKLTDDDSILDGSANPLGGPGTGNGNFSGPAYTVRKIPTILSPAAIATWDRTPTYKWTNNIPAATKYSYQLWKGTALVYTKTFLASTCGAAACMNTPTNLLPPGAYKWRVRALASGIWQPFSKYKTFTVIAPKAGYWDGDWNDFYVTPDLANVKNFSIYISVSGCGDYKITRTVLVPVTNGTFSFNGSFYASGVFTKTGVSASGTAGLYDYNIPGCGYISGGPFPWSAVWKSASEPDSNGLMEIMLLPGQEGTFPGPFKIDPVIP